MYSEKEFLVKAWLAYQQGRKKQALEMIKRVLKANPRSDEAWFLLASVVEDKQKAVYCLRRALSINPQHKEARDRLRRLLSGESESKRSVEERDYWEYDLQKDGGYSKGILEGISRVHVIGGIVLLVIIACAVFAFKPAKKYVPTSEDAFSYAAGFALKRMYANVPDYYCDGERNPNKEGAYWYLLHVTPVGQSRFRVIGATKAIDRYCVYEVGYFAATVEYTDEKGWTLIGDIKFSNPCLTVDTTDDIVQGKEGELVCDNWYSGWRPDPNWRP